MKKNSGYPPDVNQLAKLVVDIATREKNSSKKSSGKRNTKTVKKGSKK